MSTQIPVRMIRKRTIHDLRWIHYQTDFMDGLRKGIRRFRPMTYHLAHCERARIGDSYPMPHAVGNLQAMRRWTALAFVRLVLHGKVRKDRQGRYRVARKEL